MNSKYGLVKNPLTVIAIFAGTAEVSGTAVLPFLQGTNQNLYVWFLMLFPLVVVILFFATLNWNPTVLYAPSDFQNEDNFVNLIRKATTIELLTKEAEEALDAEQEITEESEESASEEFEKDSHEGETEMSESIGTAPLNTERLLELLSLTGDKVVNSDMRDMQYKIMKAIHRQRIREAQLAERLAIEKLEKELGVKVETQMKIGTGEQAFVFDGVIRQRSGLTVVEVKYWRLGKADTFYLRRFLAQVERLYETLSETQKRGFSLILIIVTDDVNERLKRTVERYLTALPFAAMVKYYEFDKLVNELIGEIA